MKLKPQTIETLQKAREAAIEQLEVLKRSRHNLRATVRAINVILEEDAKLPSVSPASVDSAPSVLNPNPNPQE